MGDGGFEPQYSQCHWAKRLLAEKEKQNVEK